MGHRVKNLFATTDGVIRMTAKSSDNKKELAEALSWRLHALAAANALVRRTFSLDGQLAHAYDFSEVIAAVLKPYAHATTSMRGPAVRIGEHATNATALVFHEMATNAAKYEAFSREAGKVAIEWSIE